MKKGIILVALLTIVFVISSLGLAANSHTVTVNVNAFARLSVSGAASGTVVETDFNADGTAVKDLTSTVKLNVKTNKSSGCVISAAAPDFASGTETFAVSKLQAKVGTTGSFVSLANTAVDLVTLAGKQNNAEYGVAFKLNLDGTETAASNYSTTVTYTIAVAP